MNQCDGLAPAYKEPSTFDKRWTEQNTNLQKTPQVKSDSQCGKGRRFIWCNIRANGCSYTTWGYSTYTHTYSNTATPEIASFLHQWGHTARNTISQAVLLKVNRQVKSRKLFLLLLLWQEFCGEKVPFDILQQQLSKAVLKCPLEAVPHDRKCQKISSNFIFTFQYRMHLSFSFSESTLCPHAVRTTESPQGTLWLLMLGSWLKLTCHVTGI